MLQYSLEILKRSRYIRFLLYTFFHSHFRDVLLLTRAINDRSDESAFLIIGRTYFLNESRSRSQFVRAPTTRKLIPSGRYLL